MKDALSRRTLEDLLLITKNRSYANADSIPDQVLVLNCSKYVIRGQSVAWRASSEYNSVCVTSLHLPSVDLVSLLSR